MATHRLPRGRLRGGHRGCLPAAPSLPRTGGCSSADDVAAVSPFRNFDASLSFFRCSPWKGSKKGVLPLSGDTTSAKITAPSHGPLPWDRGLHCPTASHRLFQPGAAARGAREAIVPPGHPRPQRGHTDTPLPAPQLGVARDRESGVGGEWASAEQSKDSACPWEVRRRSLPPRP